jgi:hypothetical protein
MSSFGDNTVIKNTLSIQPNSSSYNFPLWVHTSNYGGSSGNNFTFQNNQLWQIYYGGNGSVTTTTTNVFPYNIAIATTGNLVANCIFASYGPVVTSDIRIKKNIETIADEEGLQIIRQLHPCFYEHIDFIKNPGFVFGFIAQDVKDVLPSTIKFIEKSIPNIFESASVAADGITLTLNEKSTESFLNTDSSVVRLEIYDSNDVFYTVDVVQVIDEKTFVISSSIPTQRVFVFGQIVPDFHNISYDDIYTNLLSSVKSLDSTIQKQDLVIQSLYQELNQVLADMKNE